MYRWNEVTNEAMEDEATARKCSFGPNGHLPRCPMKPGTGGARRCKCVEAVVQTYTCRNARGSRIAWSAIRQRVGPTGLVSGVWPWLGWLCCLRAGNPALDPPCLGWYLFRELLLLFWLTLAAGDVEVPFGIALAYLYKASLGDRISEPNSGFRPF